jgi:hypothetical protein
MRHRNFVVALDPPPALGDGRFPIMVCAVVVLGVSAGSYFLIFRAMGALGLW